MNEDRGTKAIEEAIGNLIEHYDSVQILVTKHGEKTDTTSAIAMGKGNIFARIAQSKLWAETQESVLMGDAFDEHAGENPEEGK
jgi:hypothetical protein